MKIEVNNGLSFRELAFNFFKKRLCLLVGENGVGKTNVFDSLFCALYGKTTKDCPKEELVFNNEGEGVFIAEWEGYRVERRFTPSEKLAFISGGVDLTGVSIRDTQAKIDLAMGMDSSIFSNVVLYGQGQTDFFVNSTDSNQKAYLESILRFQRYTRAQKLAKQRLDGKEAEQSRLSTDRAVLEGQISQAEDELEQMRGRLKEEVEGRETRRQELLAQRKEQEGLYLKREKEVTSVKARIEGLKRQIEGYDSLSTEYQEVSSQYHQAQMEESKWKTRAENTRLEIDRVSRSREAKAGKIGTPCPTCGKPFDEESFASALKTLKGELGKHQATLKQQIMMQEEEAQKVSALAKNMAELGKAISELPKLRGKKESSEEELSEAKGEFDLVVQKITEIDRDFELLDEPSGLEELMVEKKHLIKGLVGKLGKVDKDISLISGEIAQLQFWYQGFGNAGIKSLLLDTHACYINERINHYLDKLTDGHIKALFSTTKRLKSDELRDKISFTIYIGGKAHDYKTYSGGQKTVINLATMFALRDLGRRVGVWFPLLLLDETFAALDDSYSESVLRLLKGVSKDTHIFVVSHNDGLRKSISDLILVQMENGASVVGSN